MLTIADVDVDRKARTAEIRVVLLAEAAAHPSDLITFVANRFNVSRQAVHRQVRQLLQTGKLVVEGQRRHARYRAATETHRQYFKVSKDLEEDRIWSTFAAPLLQHLKPNVVAICHHGFTEMLNNVVDHSAAGSVTLSIEKARNNVELIIFDDGVGIFNKIQQACHLENPEQAIFELSKGKLTTDPNHHSGEGIFFTSRIFDRFGILSGGLWFGHVRDDQADWLLADSKARPGTGVFMEIAPDSEHTVQEVFDAYSTTQNGMTFDKTVVALGLAGSGSLVSRSQAKRVVSRLDRFKEAVLDFTAVDGIGQAFADEIFRVYRASNPNVAISHVHANEAVIAMIERAEALGRQAQQTSLRLLLKGLFERPGFNDLAIEERWISVREALALHDPASLAALDSVDPSKHHEMLKLLVDVAEGTAESSES